LVGSRSTFTARSGLVRYVRWFVAVAGLRTAAHGFTVCGCLAQFTTWVLPLAHFSRCAHLRVTHCTSHNGCAFLSVWLRACTVRAHAAHWFATAVRSLARFCTTWLPTRLRLPLSHGLRGLRTHVLLVLSQFAFITALCTAVLRTRTFGFARTARAVTSCRTHAVAHLHFTHSLLSLISNTLVACTLPRRVWLRALRSRRGTVTRGSLYTSPFTTLCRPRLRSLPYSWFHALRTLMPHAWLRTCAPFRSRMVAYRFSAHAWLRLPYAHALIRHCGFFGLSFTFFCAWFALACTFVINKLRGSPHRSGFITACDAFGYILRSHVWLLPSGLVYSPAVHGITAAYAHLVCTRVHTAHYTRIPGSTRTWFHATFGSPCWLRLLGSACAHATLASHVPLSTILRFGRLIALHLPHTCVSACMRLPYTRRSHSHGSHTHRTPRCPRCHTGFCAFTRLLVPVTRYGYVCGCSSGSWLRIVCTSFVLDRFLVRFLWLTTFVLVLVCGWRTRFAFTGYAIHHAFARRDIHCAAHTSRSRSHFPALHFSSTFTLWFVAHTSHGWFRITRLHGTFCARDINSRVGL